MTHVELPEGFAAEEQKLPFFLAMEEFLARKGSGEYFFHVARSASDRYFRSEPTD